MSSFGDIRSIAQRPPGVGTWWDLCDAFESYSGAEPVTDRLLPYCQGQLSRWPRHVTRAMPIAWLEALASGERVVGSSLANAITNWPKMTSPQLAGLARAEGLESVRTLELSSGLSSSMMGEVYGASPVDELPFDREFANALSSLLAGPLAGLEVFILGGRTLDASLAGAIGALPGLRSLTFERCGYDEYALEALSFGAFASLRDLHIQRWPSDAISTLCESSWWSRLELLSLRGCRLGDAWVQDVCDDPSMSNLRTLDLGVNDLGLDALGSLLTSPSLRKLEVLTLDRLGERQRVWSQLDELLASRRSLVAALERSTLACLTELGLRENGLHDDELDAIRSAMSARGVAFRYTCFREQLT